MNEFYQEKKSYLFKSLGIILFLYSACVAGENNIALNKPTEQSSARYNLNSNLAVNGNSGNGWVNNHQCSFTEDDKEPWLMINLEGIYKINKVRIWNKNDGQSIGSYGRITVNVGRSFLPCSGSTLKGYTQCGSSYSQDPLPSMDIDCGRSEGQYLVIKKDTKDPLVLCEVEVFGKLITKNDIEVKPELIDEPYDLNDYRNNSARKVILKGINTIEIPQYSNSLIRSKSFAEPILWNNEDNNIVMIASTVGKGKLISVGNHNFVDSIIANEKYSQLWKNMKIWLTGKENARVTKASRLSDMKDGDIVYWNGHDKISSEDVKKIRYSLKQGIISVIFGLKAWTYKGDFESALFQDLLRDASVLLSTASFSAWHKTMYYPSKYDSENPPLAIDKGLELLLASSNAFVEMGETVLKQISEMDKKLLSGINVQKKLNLIIKKYVPLIKYIYPCSQNPTKDSKERAMVRAYNRLLLDQSLAGTGIKAPGVDSFPGDFETTPATVTPRIKLRGLGENEQHATGFYLPAGSTLTFSDIKYENSTDKDWDISIGCHTDNIGGKDEYSRYPIIFVKTSFSLGKIYSPFGGVVWIQNKKKSTAVTLTMSNVVETPFYNARDSKNMADWERRRNAPGLWAELAGDAMYFCVESKNIRSSEFNKDYLHQIMVETWDKVVKGDHNLRGTNWRTERRQRTTNDIQLSHGGGHSGYPIGTHLPWFDDMWNNKTIYGKGSWGMCHEIGHNLQQGVWTWSGTGEVTNNMMCLFNYERVFKIPFLDSRFKIGSLNKEKAHLNGKPSFETWKSHPFLSLAIYAQMGSHFGWGLFKGAFRKYPSLDIQPESDTEKIDTFVELMSETGQVNLAPLFEYWGLPVSSSVKSRLSNLCCFIPNDRFTELAPARTSEFRNMYGCNSIGHIVPDIWEDDLLPMLPNDLIEL